MTNRFFAGQTDYIEQLNALDVETGDHIADTTGAHAATAISNTPAGNIAATTVQGAINELDSEKLSASATALPSSFASASLNSITPAGGTLGVTGDASASVVTASSRVATDDINARTATRVSINNVSGTSIATFDHSTGLSSFNFGVAVTGNVSATGSLQAGAGGDGALSSVRSDNTSAIASGVNLSRGNATGTNVNISTTGDGANGVAAALLRFDGTEVMRWQPGNVAVTGSISATSLVDISAAGAGQIKFPATQNASADANTLDDYQEATYTGTATGMTTSPTGTVSYTLTGNEATLNLPEITGTSNATTFTVTGMPAEARPASRKTVLGRAQDNGGAIVPVRIDIETTGVLTIYANADAGAFTSSGTKTLAECSVTYTRV